MNRDRMAGQLKQVKGNIRKGWGRWTGDENQVERGEREHSSADAAHLRHPQDEALQQIRELLAL